MKRLGQARGGRAPPAHWLALASDPESGTRVPGHCHHPSSQPPLPSAPLTSLLLVPLSYQHLTLEAGKGCARTRHRRGGGRRAGLELHTPHLCPRARGSRRGEGADSEKRDSRPCRSGAGLEKSGGRLRAVPQQRQRPAAAAAPLRGRPRCAPGARRTRIRAPGSCALAESARPGAFSAGSPAPCLRLAARGQLRSCGAGRGAGSGRAAGRRRRRAPASRRASRPPGRRCLLLAGVESGRPCPGAGLADATEPLSPPVAALSCCPKWKRKPWDWRGRMGTRGRCRKTCKVSGRGAPRTWRGRRRRQAPPQGRDRSFGLSNRVRRGFAKRCLIGRFQLRGASSSPATRAGGFGRRDVGREGRSKTWGVTLETRARSQSPQSVTKELVPLRGGHKR